MDVKEYYASAMDQVFEKNPGGFLENLLGNDSKVSTTEVIKLSVFLSKIWESYKTNNIQVGVVIDDSKFGDKCSKIYCYDFSSDLKEILHKGEYKSIIYLIDIEGAIIEKLYYECLLTIKKISHLSSTTRKIVFFLGVNGIDTLINGTLFDAENHMDSYMDVISPRQLNICEYEKLLNMFFYDCVQYDPQRRYFARKNRIHENFHNLLKGNPKLLYSKPEELFQKDLEYFLKNKCEDPVLLEVKNKLGDRYDVWVVNNEKNIYVIEIKWLGKSITSEGSIFEEYDTNERAISGAYQLKDYIDNSDKYTKLLGLPSEMRIHCGILLVFDARVYPNEIEFPQEFEKYIHIDLKHHFKIEKSKPPASSVYKLAKKKAKEYSKDIDKASSQN